MATLNFVDDTTRSKVLLSTRVLSVLGAGCDAVEIGRPTTEEAVQMLRSRYPKIDDSVFAETTEPLNSLSTANDLELLRANASAVDGAVLKVADTFDSLSTTKEVRHIRMSEVWSGPIASAEDLDSALGRLREAVLDQLNDDTEVRFR